MSFEALWNVTEIAKFTVVSNGPMNDTTSAFYCAGGFPDGICGGICPNPDISGIGVRIAFYLGSFTNALLVFLSPQDAAQGAWASAVLTASQVLPAIIQKAQGTLTLYHACIVTNYTVMSVVTSLAIAPMVPIWRNNSLAVDQTKKLTEKAKKIEREFSRQKQVEGERGRLVLALAILIQLMLQWSWAIYLFVSPYYDGYCARETMLSLWGKGFIAADLMREGRIYLWALWLLFGMAVSSAYLVILVFSAHSRVHDEPHDGRLGPPNKWKLRFIYKDEHYWARIWVRVSQVAALALVIFFIVVNEHQVIYKERGNIPRTSIPEGWSFGQTSALLLALAPAWALAVALWGPQRRIVAMILPTSMPQPQPQATPESPEIKIEPPQSPSSEIQIVTPEHERQHFLNISRPTSSPSPVSTMVDLGMPDPTQYLYRRHGDRGVEDGAVMLLFEERGYGLPG